MTRKISGRRPGGVSWLLFSVCFVCSVGSSLALTAVFGALIVQLGAGRLSFWLSLGHPPAEAGETGGDAKHD